jgi:hypothetical protein
MDEIIPPAAEIIQNEFIEPEVPNLPTRIEPRKGVLSAKKMASFFARAIKNNETNCWEWNGCLTGNGYGHCALLNEKKAHRVSYKLHYGDILDKMIIMHKCDNRICVNPEHLQQGTHKENMSDMKDKGRAATSYKPHLTEEQVKAIYLSKSSISQLVKQYNLNIRTIERIRARRIWGKITNELVKGN